VDPTGNTPAQSHCNIALIGTCGGSSPSIPTSSGGTGSAFGTLGGINFGISSNNFGSGDHLFTLGLSAERGQAVADFIRVGAIIPIGSQNQQSDEPSFNQEARRALIGVQNTAADLDHLRMRLGNIDSPELRTKFREGVDNLQRQLEELYGLVDRDELLCGQCKNFPQKFYDDFFKGGEPGSIRDALKHTLGTRDAIVISPLTAGDTVGVLNNTVESIEFVVRTTSDFFNGGEPKDGFRGSRRLQRAQDIQNNNESLRSFVSGGAPNLNNIFIFDRSGTRLQSIRDFAGGG